MQRVSRAFKKTTDDDYHDQCKHSLSGRIFFNTVWLTVLILMCVYVRQITVQYIENSQHPSSTVGYETRESLPLPEVTVCNWNTDNAPTSDESCDYCKLEMVACTNINTSEDCTHLWKPLFVQTIGGSFNCFTFNNDPKNVTWSVTVAYAGSYATVFKYKVPNSTDEAGPTSPRAGLQATFSVQGEASPDDIYREIRFAAVGSDTFYSIGTINTIRGDLDESDINYNTTRYDTKSSAVSLLNPMVYTSDGTTGYTGISFSFETLNLQVVTYSFTYTGVNFMGDFAGMLGTLMGLDTIKVMAALPVAWAAYKMRSCHPLEDLFNG